MFDGRDDTDFHWKIGQIDDKVGAVIITTYKKFSAESFITSIVFIYATVQIIREGYKSVLMMYIVEVDNDTITGA